MKKTLTINISGIIFHIDDDAYEKLNQYIDSLRNHFRNYEGKEEILTDIEYRIAELLGSKIEEQKQVITIEDINNIIVTLGQPSDIADDEDRQENISSEISGGAKRLYRDPDNQFLGGICGGLGAYFNIDAFWFRLLFIILIIVGGSGLLIYLVMWIVVPQASNTAEKLEMCGEKVNISNIEKSIRVEFEQIRVKINDLASQAKNGYQKKSKATGGVIEDIGSIILSILKIFFRFIIIVIGIALLITGIGILVSFMAITFGWEGVFFIENHDMVDISINSILELIFPHPRSIALYKIGFMLFIAVPLIMIIYNAFRMIFKVDRIKYVGLTALNIWIVGLILTLIFAFKIAREFKYGTLVHEEIQVNIPERDTLYIDLLNYENNQIDQNYLNIVVIDDVEIYSTVDGTYFNDLEIEITESDDNKFHFVNHIISRGRNPMEAKSNAKLVEYPILSADSVITINDYFKLATDAPWRAQRLLFEIQVPADKKIIMNQELKNFIRFQRHIFRNYDWEDNSIHTWKTMFNSTGYQKNKIHKISNIGTFLYLAL